MIVRTSLPGVDQQLRDGVLARSSEARDGADRLAFAKEVEDASAIGGRELVHEREYRTRMLIGSSILSF